MKRDARVAFAKRLQMEAEHNERIMVLTSDSMGSSCMTDFYKAMPERFVEIGIAEQDSVGVGAGLSLTGKQPFVCGPACFLMMRSQEQVKTDVAYSNTNTKIIGVSAGMSYGVLGATHHALGDFAAARMMPGLAILAPSDAAQASEMAAFLAEYKGPAYLRMGRGKVEDIYPDGSGCFTFGKANVLSEGKDVLLCAIGEEVYPALEAQKALAEKGICATVLDIHTLRPFDTDAVRKYAADAKLVVSVEEHYCAGGLGDAVSMAIADMGRRQLRIGMPDQYLPCDSSAGLKKQFGLDAAGIEKKILAAL